MLRRTLTRGADNAGRRSELTETTSRLLDGLLAHEPDKGTKSID
jgi:hypothetical protein